MPQAKTPASLCAGPPEPSLLGNAKGSLYENHLGCLKIMYAVTKNYNANAVCHLVLRCYKCPNFETSFTRQ